MPALKMLKRRDEIAEERGLLLRMTDSEILASKPPKYRARDLPARIALLLGAELDVATGCWEWRKSRSTGPSAGRGYGHLYIGRRLERAHRVAYREFVGPIPDSLVIDHRCGNQGCVNPGHLRAVTQQVNILASSGLGARYAVATHCDRGHPFSGHNLIMLKEGKRRCRACCKMTVEERRSFAIANRPICEAVK